MTCGRYISWKHWSVIGSVTALTALLMAIRAPAYHTNLNETIYFALPGMLSAPLPLSCPATSCTANLFGCHTQVYNAVLC